MRIIKAIVGGLTVLALAACSPAAPQAGSPGDAPDAYPSRTHDRTAEPGSPWIPTGSATTAANQIVCLVPDDDPEAAKVAARVQALQLPPTAGTMGFAVHDQRTGATCSLHGGAGFQSASVIKVATVATLLWQAEATGVEVSDDEYALAEAAITISDNDAQESLWLITGGTAGLSELLTVAGMTSTVPSFTDEDWGLTTITADDELRLVQGLVTGVLLNPEHTSYLLGLMTSLDPEQIWGVSAGAPPGSVVALKNGWLDDPLAESDDWVEPTWTNNSIGQVTTPDGHSYSMTVLTNGNTSDADGRAYASAVAALIAGAVLGS